MNEGFNKFISQMAEYIVYLFYLTPTYIIWVHLASLKWNRRW